MQAFRDVYVQGLWGARGDRVVEVVLVDSCSNTWRAYATIAGRVVKSDASDPHDKRGCLAGAKRFLAGEITPECWDCVRDIRH